MKRKETKFDLTCEFVVNNLEYWNSRVKEKKYQLNSDDSSSLKVVKIYRYLNEHDADICRFIQQEPNIERGANLK